jgi:hypothetical protein
MEVLPSFLIPEAVIRDDGAGPPLALGEAKNKLLLLTLGITRIIEQESLEISVWGSADGVAWGAKPLASFPQKFNCGTYQLLVDLSDQPEVQYVCARYKVNRWGHTPAKPLFGVYLFVQETEPHAVAKTA